MRGEGCGQMLSTIFRKCLSKEARGGLWTKTVNVGVKSTWVVLKAKGAD